MGLKGYELVTGLPSHLDTYRKLLGMSALLPGWTTSYSNLYSSEVYYLSSCIYKLTLLP